MQIQDLQKVENSGKKGFGENFHVLSLSTLIWSELMDGEESKNFVGQKCKS